MYSLSVSGFVSDSVCVVFLLRRCLRKRQYVMTWQGEAGGIIDKSSVGSHLLLSIQCVCAQTIPFTFVASVKSSF